MIKQKKCIKGEAKNEKSRIWHTRLAESTIEYEKISLEKQKKQKSLKGSNNMENRENNKKRTVAFFTLRLQGKSI